jgi:hypothetical protein
LKREDDDPNVQQGEMTMKAIVAALALAGMAVPSAAQTLRSAEGDWSGLPALAMNDVGIISGEVPVAMQRLVASGECTLRGVSKRKVDMTVPFLVRFSSDNQVEDVVIRKLGCAKAESILGSAIVKLAQAGALKPTGENTTGWYRSELSFEYS